MRFVDRTPMSPPTDWQTSANASTLVAEAQKKGHKARNDVYAAPALKQALDLLFKGKCAYCEICTAGTWDVDHYRPAGAVTEDESHPGYYWLAYTWSNLFPACQGCNRRLIDHFEPAKKGQGKHSQFPLVQGSFRATKPSDDLTKEQRLLLNPCNDDPSLHLTLLPTGELAPRNGSQMGQKTIEVLGLNKRMRCQHRQKILARLYRFQRNGLTAELAEELKDDCPYSGLVSSLFSILIPKLGQTP